MWSRSWTMSNIKLCVAIKALHMHTLGGLNESLNLNLLYMVGISEMLLCRSNFQSTISPLRPKHSTIWKTFPTLGGTLGEFHSKSRIQSVYYFRRHFSLCLPKTQESLNLYYILRNCRPQWNLSLYFIEISLLNCN